MHSYALMDEAMWGRFVEPAGRIEMAEPFASNDVVDWHPHLQQAVDAIADAGARSIEKASPAAPGDGEPSGADAA